jgi:hypothetical protein
MELVGEEKRIQALFSNVRLADEQITPSFAGVWNRAQPKTVRTQRAFNLSFVAATALLVCALVSLAWWSRNWQRNPDVNATVPAVPATSPVKAGIDPVKVGGENIAVNSSRPGPKRYDASSKSPAMKLAARREALLVAANRKATHEAKAIASWKSPTATLLDSSSGELLKSLPQLNQTVDELKSFLPSQPK